MNERFSRTEMLIGEQALQKLQSSRVALFGAGGVGGSAAEALVRSGVGKIDIIDNDKVALSNLNRQIIALTSTIGKYKVDVLRDRLLDINPDLKINTYKVFFMPENADEFDFTAYDYVIDAIDTIKAKIELVMRCEAAKTPIISSMGAGNRLDASAFKTADIYKTSVCPLARVMRTELKKRKIKHLKTVYSAEIPVKPLFSQVQGNKRVPGSFAPAAAAAGLVIAGEVIRDLVKL